MQDNNQRIIRITIVAIVALFVGLIAWAVIQSIGRTGKVAVTGNSFGTGTRHQYCGIIMPVTTKLVEARNYFTDNHAFRISRGA